MHRVPRSTKKPCRTHTSKLNNSTVDGVARMQRGFTRRWAAQKREREGKSTRGVHVHPYARVKAPTETVDCQQRGGIAMFGSKIGSGCGPRVLCRRADRGGKGEQRSFSTNNA